MPRHEIGKHELDETYDAIEKLEDVETGGHELGVWFGRGQITGPVRFPAHRGTALACRLTCAFASCLEREVSLRRFSHVVAGCGAAVL